MAEKTYYTISGPGLINFSFIIKFLFSLDPHLSAKRFYAICNSIHRTFLFYLVISTDNSNVNN